MSTEITAGEKPTWAARLNPVLRLMAGSGLTPSIVTKESSSTKLVVRFPSRVLYLDPLLMLKLTAVLKLENLAMVMVATNRGIFLTIGDEATMEDMTGAKV